MGGVPLWVLALALSLGGRCGGWSLSVLPPSPWSTSGFTAGVAGSAVPAAAVGGATVAPTGGAAAAGAADAAVFAAVSAGGVDTRPVVGAVVAVVGGRAVVVVVVAPFPSMGVSAAMTFSRAWGSRAADASAARTAPAWVSPDCCCGNDGAAAAILIDVSCRALVSSGVGVGVGAVLTDLSDGGCGADILLDWASGRALLGAPLPLLPPSTTGASLRARPLLPPPSLSLSPLQELRLAPWRPRARLRTRVGLGRR